jgi:hypothetical protein
MEREIEFLARVNFPFFFIWQKFVTQSKPSKLHVQPPANQSCQSFNFSTCGLEALRQLPVFFYDSNGLENGDRHLQCDEGNSNEPRLISVLGKCRKKVNLSSKSKAQTAKILQV